MVREQVVAHDLGARLQPLGSYLVDSDHASAVEASPYGWKGLPHIEVGTDQSGTAGSVQRAPGGYRMNAWFGQGSQQMSHRRRIDLHVGVDVRPRKAACHRIAGIEGGALGCLSDLEDDRPRRRFPG